MSRGYRLQWAASLRRQMVKDQRETAVADVFRMEVDLLPILPRPEMLERLAEALAEAGWTRRGDVVETTRKDVVVSLRDGQLEARVKRQGRVSGSGASAAEARVAANEAAERAEGRMQAQLTRELQALEVELRPEIEQAVQRVYVAALEAKARRMGEVQSVLERVDENGQAELVIKVKV